jgi:type II secretory pathway component GspD/PulD (secretin)
LKVTHATPEKVRLELSTEVSHLDPDLSRGDLPGVQTSRIRTQVDAEFGKALFLSGLFTRDERRSRQGLPFLSRIPVLGWLFGARNSWEDESELLAILIPRTATAEELSGEKP